MKYKDDWPEAAERWAALWEGRRLDRPCMCITAPKGGGHRAPQPRSGEEKYLDPGYVVPATLAFLESTHFGGEAIPSQLLNGGWVATCYGARPRLSLETIWFEPREFDWQKPPTFELDPGDPWHQRYLTLHKAVTAAAGRDDFMVGGACLLPANDMLARLMGTETFMLGLVEHPDWMRQRLAEAMFHVKRTLTVSHFRLPVLKKLVPARTLASLDGLCQPTGAWWQLTPSVFFQCGIKRTNSATPTEKLFRCPTCGSGDLAASPEALACEQCQRRWPIADGIYHFKDPL